MNTRTLLSALLIAALPAIAAPLMAAPHSADTIPTLPTVQVRPDAALLNEAIARRVVTLPTVQVRPDASLLAEDALNARVVTLATVQVRPSRDQHIPGRLEQAVAVTAHHMRPISLSLLQAGLHELQDTTITVEPIAIHLPSLHELTGNLPKIGVIAPWGR